MTIIRKATIKDIDDLVRFRTALFREMGILQEETNTFQNACREYFRQYLATGEFLSWVAENNNEIIATSGLVFTQKPPDPRNISGRETYVMNFYTLPKWRKQGIATKLMEEIIAFTKEKGIKLMQLHTTEIARKTYEKIGFILVNNVMEQRTK